MSNWGYQRYVRGKHKSFDNKTFDTSDELLQFIKRYSEMEKLILEFFAW